MQKEELLQFIDDFYENRLPFCVVYTDYNVYRIGRTEEILPDNKVGMRLLTYGGPGSDTNKWSISIHEYTDGRAVPLGTIEFFKSEYEAKKFAQGIINKVAEDSYVPEETFSKWLEMGLMVPDSIIKRMNEQFIANEERLEGQLVLTRAARAAFFKKYC